MIANVAISLLLGRAAKSRRTLVEDPPAVAVEPYLNLPYYSATLALFCARVSP
jgi:hypothetical protein